MKTILIIITGQVEENKDNNFFTYIYSYYLLDIAHFFAAFSQENSGKDIFKMDYFCHQNGGKQPSI